MTSTPPAPVIAADTFTRTVTNGWGSADTGGAWTVSTATAFAVNTGTGAITGAAGSTRSAYLTAATATDVDLVVDVALGTAATGGGAYVSIIGRRVASTTDYRAKLRYTSNGRITAQLVRVVAGVETALTTIVVPGLTLAAGDRIRYRLQVTGTTATTLRLKVWRSGTAEPTTWLSSITDATPAALRSAGHPGVQLYTSSSWTGAAPIVRIDDLRVTRPPSLTPTRSARVAAQAATARRGAGRRAPVRRRGRSAVGRAAAPAGRSSRGPRRSACGATSAGCRRACSRWRHEANITASSGCDAVAQDDLRHPGHEPAALAPPHRRHRHGDGHEQHHEQRGRADHHTDRDVLVDVGRDLADRQRTVPHHVGEHGERVAPQRSRQDRPAVARPPCRSRGRSRT